MKLYELVYSVTLQGYIRISTWENEEEKILGIWKNCEQLYSSEIKDEWLDMEVSYIFCPGDGFLHIEVKND